MTFHQRLSVCCLLLLLVVGRAGLYAMERQSPAALVSNTVKAAEASAAVDEDSRPSAHNSGLVHVNYATTAELQILPGIGPVLAERIVSTREEARFEHVTDLLRVPGIGEVRLEQIRSMICLENPDAEEEPESENDTVDDVPEP